MLSGVLKSDTAVIISIQIMGAFVAMRRFISSNARVFHRLDIVERKVGENLFRIPKTLYSILYKNIEICLLN